MKLAALARASPRLAPAFRSAFLHFDKPHRHSLIFDALEPLRPLIDAQVRDFIVGNKFERGDFFRLSTGHGVSEVARAARIDEKLLLGVVVNQKDLRGDLKSRLFKAISVDGDGRISVEKVPIRKQENDVTGESYEAAAAWSLLGKRTSHRAMALPISCGKSS